MSLISFKGFIDCYPFVFGELVLVQAELAVDILVVAEVHVELGVVCWEEANR